MEMNFPLKLSTGQLKPTATGELQVKADGANADVGPLPSLVQSTAHRCHSQHPPLPGDHTLGQRWWCHTVVQGVATLKFDVLPGLGRAWRTSLRAPSSALRQTSARVEDMGARDAQRPVEARDRMTLHEGPWVPTS